MNRTRPSLTQDEIGQLIALLAVLLGAFLYLYPPYLAGFPINDGGLFYTMIRSLQAEGFRWPQTVQYNGLSIPFSYPPLGFYIGAGLSSLLRADPILILRWFPGAVLVLASVAMYVLARRVLGSSVSAGIATFLYVCTPRSMTWLVMGGGLTRSLGQLFLVLTAATAYSLYAERRRKWLLLTILFGALVVLSHPEAAVHTAALCVLLWAFKGRSRRSLLDSLLVAAGILVLTSVWWLPAIMRYGLGPFIAAGRTGGVTPGGALIYVALMAFTEEPLTTVIAVLGVIGFIVCLVRRDFLLPLWLLVAYVVEPRNAGTVAAVPCALMAAIALHEIVLPGIARISERRTDLAQTGYLGSWAAKLTGLYLASILLELAFFAGSQLSTVRVSDGNRVALDWIAANTPADSRFLVMTGDNELFCDPVQEWFPALTQRVSETTIQGLEWNTSGLFYPRIEGLPHLQACLTATSPLDCVEAQAQSMGLQYDYIYVAEAEPMKRFCRPLSDARRGAALVLQLERAPGYSVIYQTPAVSIFALEP